MNAKTRSFVVGNYYRVLFASVMLMAIVSGSIEANDLFSWLCRSKCADNCSTDNGTVDQLGSTWYWMRSQEDEKRHVMALYNRYCIRCHGVDGRGVWDIPDVPNFTNARWQACRSDGQIVNSIIKGRGAVMPPFRGTLNLEEAWAMARYLRTFVPGKEVSRPDLNVPEKPATTPK
jgi:hypothetical protein